LHADKYAAYFLYTDITFTSGKRYVKIGQRRPAMSKREFLDTLRQTLEGEIEAKLIEQHIRYYDDYLSNSSGRSEEDILNELGDPRLIAKTIIDSEKIAAQRNQQTYNNSHSYRDYSYSNDNSNRNEYSNRNDYSYGNNSSEESKNYRTGREYGNDGYRTGENQGRRSFFTNITWYHKAIIIAIVILIFFILLIIGRVILKLLSIFAIPLIMLYLIYSLFRRR
jgi:uncharacterized membrane protein